MKFYVIAGEASGDLHGSNLMKAMLAKEPTTAFRFWGGDRMAAVAGQPVKHIRDLAFMGFIEVLANIRTIMANIKFCKADILKYQPDAIILIDYPGFNLRIADFANEHNIPVHYYISPQVWAWKQNRVFKIRNIVDQMYCILPFEKDFYKKFEMDVHYVGHPLLDAIEEFKKTALSKSDFSIKYHLSEKKILALLPGSRSQEISIKLPIMLKAAQAFSEYDVLVAGAPNISKEFYQKLASKQPIHLIQNDTYNLLNNAHLAMVTSGTATLETALFKIPEVVCYKGSNISYQIAKRLIKVKYISLVNLIMDKLVVKELIQHDLNPENIVHELKNLKDNQHDAYTTLMQNYTSLAEILGGGGASQRTAELILNYTKQ